MKAEAANVNNELQANTAVDCLWFVDQLAPSSRKDIPQAYQIVDAISTVLGCGVMPAGQALTRNFMVTGFTLPVSMAYTDTTTVTSQVPGIESDKRSAQTFVERFVMKTASLKRELLELVEKFTIKVFDVLERQGRTALLPDAVISNILSQLTVDITYKPILCQIAVRDVNNDMIAEMKKQNCIIVGNTVTGICTVAKDKQMCTKAGNMALAVPANHTPISRTLSTTNIIMANWSRIMWQNVVDRAVRMLASGPFRSHFFSAHATSEFGCAVF
ncbi:hypothetical protein KIN20_013082 [Parelaphostrongylus tenuis]|uniref:Uncharacterized protein n=1 Tax=Parelaphostrongylus tenuis TaxID=148309 RepID=A0AAD5QQS7_PARTN|nr:hypothetical protein KIN20_013082 [Parelaphostrongylus tenuis]